MEPFLMLYIVETKVTFTRNFNSSQMTETSNSLNSTNIWLLRAHTVCHVRHCGWGTPGLTFKQLPFPVKLQRMMAKTCQVPLTIMWCNARNPREEVCGLGWRSKGNLSLLWNPSHLTSSHIRGQKMKQMRDPGEEEKRESWMARLPRTHLHLPRAEKNIHG